MAIVYYPKQSVMLRRDTISASYEQVVLSTQPNTILYFGSGSELSVLSASTFYMTASNALTASFVLNGGGGGGLSTGSTYPITASWAISASYAPGSSGTGLTTGSTYPITASYAEQAITVDKITKISSSAGDVIELHSSIEPATGKIVDIGNFGATNPINSVQATSVYGETVYVDTLDIRDASVITANAPIVGTLQGTSSWSNSSSLSTSSSYAVTASYALNGGSGGGGLSTGSSYPITASWAISSSYATLALNVLNGSVSASYAATASYAENAKYIRTLQAPADQSGTIYFDDLLLPAQGGGYIGDSSTPIVEINAQFLNVANILSADYVTAFGSSTGIGVWQNIVMDLNNPSTASVHKLVGTASYADKSLTVEKITKISSSAGDVIELHNSIEPAAGKIVDIGNFGAINPINSVQATSVYGETVYTDTLDIRDASVITAISPIAGTLQGTASWSNSSSLSTSSSYALTASYALNGGSSGGSLSTGSTYPITSSWAVSSSYTSFSQTNTISSSWASSSLSSSYALTASFALNGGGGNSLSTGSTYPITASWSNKAQSSLYASQSNWAVSSSYASSSISASYSLSASYAPSSPSISASYALSSSYSLDSGVIVKSADAPSNPTQGLLWWDLDDATINTVISSSYALTASFALNGGGGGGLSTGSSYPITASWAISASYAPGGTGLNTGSTYPITSSFAVSSSYSLTVERITKISSSAGDVIELHNSIEPVVGTTIDIGNFGSINPINSVQATSVQGTTVATDTLDILNASVITVNAPLAGTLQGTASYAINSLSASYAITSSYSLNSGTTLVTGSTYSITASWSNNSQQSLYSSHSNWSISSSYASSSVSSSYALSASYALTGGSGGTTLFTGSTYPITSSWSNNAQSASYWNSSSIVNLIGTKQNSLTTGSTYSITSSWSNNSQQSLYASQSNWVVSASYASSSISASYASSSAIATNLELTAYNISVLYSSQSNWSISSSYASSSISSSYATFSLTASYVLNSVGGGSLSTGSSYPITASWSNNAQTASYILDSSYLTTTRRVEKEWDFITFGASSGDVDGWSFTNGPIGTSTSEYNHPGIVNRFTTTTPNQICSFHPSVTAGTVTVAIGKWTDFTFIIKPSTTIFSGSAVTCSMQSVGLMTNLGTLGPANGFYFERSGSDENWFGVVRSGSVQARVDTTIPYTGSSQWYNLTAVHDNNNAYFYVDGTLRGTLASSASADSTYASTSLAFGHRQASLTTLAYTISIDYIRLRANNIER